MGADEYLKKITAEAVKSGYNITPDVKFAESLCQGMLTNIERYGYASCPCRLGEGVKEEDLDIICPCDYRDADIEKYGACYCGLYVDKDIAEGKKEFEPIPESRPPVRPEKKEMSVAFSENGKLAYPVWRCKVCGYLAARDAPPGVCPICKAQKDRFERFL